MVAQVLSRTLTIPNVKKELMTTGNLIHCCWKGKMLWLLWETVWLLLKSASCSLNLQPRSVLLMFTRMNWKLPTLKLAQQRYSQLPENKKAINRPFDWWIIKLSYPCNAVLLINKGKLYQATKCEKHFHWFLKGSHLKRLHVVWP